MSSSNAAPYQPPVGARVRLLEPVRATCCDTMLAKGEIVLVLRYTSRNRALVQVGGPRGCMHKIKVSAMRRAGQIRLVSTSVD